MALNHGVMVAPWGHLAVSGDISIVVTDVCVHVRVWTCVCVL